MGRYWNTSYASGKFGFGVQDSSDAEIFGMSPVSVQYSMCDCEEHRESIKEVLDQQYDILKVPKKKRVYTATLEDDPAKIAQWLSDEYGYKVVPKGQGNYYCSDEDAKKAGFESNEGLCMAEKVKGASLAICRVEIGLSIMLDLELDGICTLTAEL